MGSDVFYSGSWNETALSAVLRPLLNESESVSVPEPMGVVEGSIVGTLLGVLILGMIIGNLFVILAILLDRELQRPQYYLILSLAFADLIVGVVVSPLAAINQVHRSWRLGVQLCDFWISMDVLACTSSILHLVAIALDRYWSITDVVYIQNRTPFKVVIMLAVVWFLSLVISVAPIFGWKDEEFHDRVNLKKECLISQDVGYQLFSTTAAFYGPLILIIVVYWQIYKAAKTRINKSRARKINHQSVMCNNKLGVAAASNNDATTTTTTTTTTALTSPLPSRLLPILARIKRKTSNSNVSLAKEESVSCLDSGDTPEEEEPPANAAAASLKPQHCNGLGNNCASASNIAVSFANEETRLCAETSIVQANPPKKSASMLRLHRRKRKKESAESRRERKAWRTLAIITGTFVICWLPFFILAVVRPLFQFKPDPIMESVFLWLGYINCAINPIIYTIFSPDFRNAFKKILSRMCSIKNTTHRF